MSNDRSEHKAYRKSPGRQYGYDYDPLRSQSGRSQSGSTGSRSGTLLSQRPDPRRTRQLLRKSIIDSKRANEEETEVAPDIEHESRTPSAPPVQRPRETRRIVYTRQIDPYEDEELVERPSRRPPSRGARPGPHHWPSTRELTQDDEDELDEYPAQEDYQDEDLYESEMAQMEIPRRPLPPEQPRRQARPTRVIEPEEHSYRIPERTRHIREEGPDEDYIYEDHELPPGLRKVKSGGGVTRRGLLVGAGIVAGGLGVAAAVELAPKVSKNIGDTEHQIQTAFNQGVQHGADVARKEWVTALDNLEGATLQAAIDAAALTRTAYDVFVSPIITFGANLATDFLTAMLNAFKTARHILQGVYQDNDTLAAIQKVLESWVLQVSNLPKQLNAITETDLDGAQAYLRKLQHKIEDEKAKLNATPTPAPKPQPGATPTQKPKQ